MHRTVLTCTQYSTIVTQDTSHLQCSPRIQYLTVDFEVVDVFQPSGGEHLRHSDHSHLGEPALEALVRDGHHGLPREPQVVELQVGARRDVGLVGGVEGKVEGVREGVEPPVHVLLKRRVPVAADADHGGILAHVLVEQAQPLATCKK